MGLRSQNNPIASFRDVFSRTGKDAVIPSRPVIEGHTATGGDGGGGNQGPGPGMDGIPGTGGGGAGGQGSGSPSTGGRGGGGVVIVYYDT